MLNNNQLDEGYFWFSKYLDQNSELSPLNFIFLADKIRENRPQECLALFKKAAFKRNYLAIGAVIDIYEKDMETRDLSKALLWRKTLPPVWQERSMDDFLGHLEGQNYDFDTIVDLEIPAELLP